MLSHWLSTSKLGKASPQPPVRTTNRSWSQWLRLSTSRLGNGAWPTSSTLLNRLTLSAVPKTSTRSSAQTHHTRTNLLSLHDEALEAGAVNG